MARCEICRKDFGSGEKNYQKAVAHVKKKHGKIEPKRPAVEKLGRKH